MASISGLQKQVDEDTQNQIGKLLVAEEDEDVTPNAETWTTLYGMLGGLKFIIIFLSFNVIRRYLWHT